MVEKGMKAPSFSLPNQDGELVSLASFKGRWVVLYFYPKDNTSGCTKEAVDFTALREQFASLGAEVVGVSPDSVDSHAKFISKHDLGVTLLSDSDSAVMKAYGAWGLKKNYGKEYEGVIRSTFLISPEQVVRAAWSKVKVQVKRRDGVVKHAEKVLCELEEHVK